MRSKATLSMTLFAALSIGCGLLNPAGSKLSEAEELAANGNHDGAVVAYQELATAYPESPEAALAPARIVRTLVDKASQELDAGEPQQAGKTATRFMSYGVPADKVEAIVREKDPSLMYVARYYGGTLMGADNEALGILLQIPLDLEAARVEEPAIIQAVATTINDTLDSYPAFLSCKKAAEIDTDTEELSSLASALDGSEASCDLIGKTIPLLTTDTQAELKTMITAATGARATWAERAGQEQQQVITELRSIQEEFDRLDKAQRSMEVRYGPDIAAGSRRALTAAAREMTRLGNQREPLADRCTEMAEQMPTKPWPLTMKIEADDVGKKVCPLSGFGRSKALR